MFSCCGCLHLLHSFACSCRLDTNKSNTSVDLKKPIQPENLEQSKCPEAQYIAHVEGNLLCQGKGLYTFLARESFHSRRM